MSANFDKLQTEIDPDEKVPEGFFSKWSDKDQGIHNNLDARIYGFMLKT